MSFPLLYFNIDLISCQTLKTSDSEQLSILKLQKKHLSGEIEQQNVLSLQEKFCKDFTVFYIKYSHNLIVLIRKIVQFVTQNIYVSLFMIKMLSPW